MKIKLIVGGIVIITAFVIFAYGLGMFDKVKEPMSDVDKKRAEINKAYALDQKIGQERKAYLEGLLKADTYGGTTPEETLSMYMEALRAGDAELAAKYYLPWEQEKALEDTNDWVNINPDALKIYLTAYDKKILDIEKLTLGYSITMFNDRADEYGYGIFDFELNEINNIWKLHDEKFDTRGYK